MKTPKTTRRCGCYIMLTFALYEQHHAIILHHQTDRITVWLDGEGMSQQSPPDNKHRGSCVAMLTELA